MQVMLNKLKLMWAKLISYEKESKTPKNVGKHELSVTVSIPELIEIIIKQLGF